MGVVYIASIVAKASEVICPRSLSVGSWFTFSGA
jgi:hypothetical protein